MRAPLLLLVFAAVVAHADPQQSVKHERVADIDADSVSSDGHFLSHTDWTTGHLAIRDLETGQSRNLTSEGWPKGAYASKISPDGKHVAYYFDTSGGRDELRIIGADGTGERVLYSDGSITWTDPHDWSPDGKYVVAVFTTAARDGPLQIALVPVVGGPPRVLKALPRWCSPLTVSFSPDGRHVAYDVPPEANSQQRDLIVLAVESGSEAVLVGDPANDLLLDWTPDGKAVLFAREHDDAWDLWAVRVLDGKSGGHPELIRSGLMPVAGSLGFTRDGSLYYVSASWTNDLYVADLDGLKGKPRRTMKLVSHVAWESSPAYSPDGKQLAYVQQRGLAGLRSLILVIRSVKTSHDRELPLKLGRLGGHAFQPQWSPDSRFLLVQGRDEDLQQGIYRIDRETGAVTPIVQSETPCPMDCLEWPVWSPDGKVIFNRWLRRSIVARDAESGRETAIHTNLPTRVSHLGVSPNGQRLAFVMRDGQSGKTFLKAMPTTGGKAVELVDLPAPAPISAGQPAVQLAWTPDSRHLIYAVGIGGGKPRTEFWRISTSGGKPQRLGLTLEGVLPYGLTVAPGGNRIAFTAGTPRRREVRVVRELIVSSPDQTEGTGPQTHCEGQKLR